MRLEDTEVLDVNILKHYSKDNSYYLEYSLKLDSGIIRHSKTYYKNGELLRDNEHIKLKNIIKEKIEVYRKSIY